MSSCNLKIALFVFVSLIIISSFFNINNLYCTKIFSGIKDELKNKNYTYNDSKNILCNTSETGTINLNESDNHVVTDRKNITPLIPWTINIDHRVKEVFSNMDTGFCSIIRKEEELAKEKLGETFFLHVNFNFDCKNIFQYSTAGTGNWIYFIYVIRYIAYSHGKISLKFTCNEALIDSRNLMLPWLMGWFPFNEVPVSIANENFPDFNESCKFPQMISLVLPLIKYDLRRFAIGLVGQSENTTLSSYYTDFYHNAVNSGYFFMSSIDGEPKIDNIKLDDAVLHVRCGDVLMNPHYGYGFMKYKFYRRFLDENVRTIGIVTHPFETYSDVSARGFDHLNESGLRCSKIVHGLVTYLTASLPNVSSITIHNGPSESVALSIARLVMTRISISSVSTLSFYSVLATFGIGVIPLCGDIIYCLWLKLKNLTDNYISTSYCEQEFLSATKAYSMWTDQEGEEKVLNWFKNDSYIV